MSDSFWPHGRQPARLLCPWDSLGKNSGVGCHSLLQGIPWPQDQTWVYSLLKFMSIESVMPSNHLILYRPLLLLLQSFPASESFLMSWLFTSGGQSIGASVSAPILPMNIQGWFSLRLTGLPCGPRDSQESSPIPQFKSISSLAFSFLYSPTLTSIHDYWKNHSFDQMDLCLHTSSIIILRGSKCQGIKYWIKS